MAETLFSNHTSRFDRELINAFDELNIIKLVYIFSPTLSQAYRSFLKFKPEELCKSSKCQVKHNFAVFMFVCQCFSIFSF